MKICFIVGFYPEVVGGAEYQARMIADVLSKYHEIVYISPADAIDCLKIVDGYKIYKRKINRPLFHKYSFYYFYMNEITRIIKIEKPDIVYQRILNSFSFFIAKTCKHLKIPFVLHIADDKCLKFESRDISTLVRYFLFNRLKQYEPNYICQTEVQRKLLNGLNQQAKLTVPNFSKDIDYVVKLDTYPRKVVWIANVRPFKRLDIFLDLVDRLSFLSNVEFHIIGAIPENNYGYKIRTLIKNSIAFYHGSRSNEYINDLLTKSFILINTSDVNTEGFSNTFIQAWMTGTPVLSLGNNPNNYIDDYGLGYYAEGNIDFLLESVRRLLSLSYNEYALMSVRCREFALEHFSTQKNISKILELFNTL